MTLLGLVVAGGVFLYTSGMRQADMTAGHAAAVQNAQVLLAILQQDLRQIAVLPGRGFPVLPYSISLSRHGKSFTIRRSADTTDLGSGFSMVTYQLTAVPSRPGTYHTVRSQRAPEGDPLPDQQAEPDRDDALASLRLRDVKMDLTARIEPDGRIRHFLELTLLAIADDRWRGEEKTPVYPISALFALPAPDPIEDFCADAFVEPPRNITANLQEVPIIRGRGNERPIEPPPDVFDGTRGTDLRTPGDEGLARTGEALLRGFGSLRAARRPWIYGILVYLASTVGPTYPGRIVGDVVSEPGPDGKPTWREPFEIAVRADANDPVLAQVDRIWDRVARRGPGALMRFLELFKMRPGMDRARQLTGG